ncbi:MAG: hypothetical protein COZ06_33160 [Armatimonadetes bacterium CG_4_10_14_3_um_filter_66_18]|nr:MAG: hypothetical protein COZ06_33160 [Armatimonadetes bacterium CG_4_10_14_3_um_filter_66_18]
MNALSLVLALALLFACLPLQAADLLVSPAGDDANPGTKDRPFATLTHARDAARELRRANPAEPVAVLLRGGTYRLVDTVVFGIEDGGVAYAAFPGERPVVSGGVPVTKWTKADRALAGLPEAARGDVWVADVSFVRDLKANQAPAATVATQFDRGWRFFTLYEGGRRLPRARGKGFNQTQAIVRGTPDDRRTVHFPEGALRNWPDLQEAELAIIPSYYWISNILPLASVDEANAVAMTTVPGTYSLGKNGLTDRPTAFVENVLEVLDQPGEWVLDAENAKLYLWPEGDRPSDETIVPVLTELIRVEGKIDYAGPTDTPVKDLSFRGLTFTQGDRLSWHGGTGWGLQHDWERFDSPTALLRLRGAENCVVEDCHFVNSGHTGIRLDLHCRKNRLVGNHLEHLGGVGILLCGYGPGTKDVNRENEVSNNYLHDTGELYWGSPALFVWQSGENRIAHNHTHHIPYTGLCVTGRISWDPKGAGECSRTVRWTETGLDPAKGMPRLSWQEREKWLHGRNNVVERNDIHNAMQVTGDGNCIYVSGAGGGNVIRENYCHDCDGKYMNAVLRNDDDQNGTLFEGNLLARTRGAAEGIISKGDNDLVNNFVVDLRPDARQRGYLVFPYGTLKGSVIQRNVFYSRQAGQTVLYEGAARGGTPAPRLHDADADYNLYWCAADPDWGAQHLESQQKLGIEKHSLAADPLFVDPANGDYRLQPQSPALKLGIKPPVSLDEVGLEEPYRSRLLGKRLTTRITPEQGTVRQPLTVTITADAAAAQIHYTIDGSEPTGRSPLYAKPLVLTAAATVRAKSFAPGATDLIGAVAAFAGPPKPLREDFESVAVGERAPGATTTEENEPNTARVSDEQAASGKQSLKFIDGPGQKAAYNPHVFYRLSFTEGRVLGWFSVFVDAATQLCCQWRQYDGGKYSRGPSVQISPGGKVELDGKELLTIPTGKWVRFEVRCALGDEATGTFDLTVSVRDADPRTFADLPCEPGFTRLDWVGFVPNGQQECVCYVDDVEVGEAGRMPAVRTGAEPRP